MNRRVVAVLVALLLVAAPAAGQTDLPAGYEEKLSGQAESVDGFFGFHVPSNAVTYGADQDLGWFVTYEDGKYGSISAWVNETSERELIATYNDTNMVLVRSPPEAIFGGVQVTESDVSWAMGVPTVTLGGDGLLEAGYVRSVDLNVEHQRTEPVEDLISESERTAPLPNLLVRGGWNAEGVAYAGDVNTTTISDVRNVTDVDQVATNGTGINVSVIDTGANVGSGQAYGNGTAGSALRVMAAKNFITNSSVNVSASNPDWGVVKDGNGHGSWVASAIAADSSNDTYDGMAPGASLLVAKALADDGSGTTQDIVEAIRWSDRNGADVVSMSLGSPRYSPTIAAALRDALDGNVTVAVLAVGNSRQNPAFRFVASPADVPDEGVVSVAATNTEPAGNSSSAYFSNVGPDTGARDLSNGATAGVIPDVGAPGMQVQVEVISTAGVEQTSTLSGTSMATPIVAGAVAHALEANPGWLNESATTAGYLSNTSHRMPRAGTTEVGHGMVNVASFSAATENESSQEEVRTVDAIARDNANEQYSGGSFYQRIASFELPGVSEGAS